MTQRKRQPLPLYRSLRNPDTDIISLAKNGSVINMKSYYPAIASAVPFNVQIASDIYWKGDQDHYTFKEVGPLRVPFPLTWMEWEIPKVIRVNKKIVKDTSLTGIRCGILLSEKPLLKTETPYGAFDSMLFTHHPKTGMTGVWPHIMRFITDDEDLYVKHAFIYPPDMDKGIAEQLGQSYAMLCVPMIIALGLINCRNVKSAPAGELVIPRPRQANHRRKDRNVSSQRVVYHTIVLPGGVEYGTAHSPHDRLSTGEVAVHRVRGHFKHYTKAAPLFGKETGRYWWGWQVRGNPAAGEVHSEYELRK